MFGKLELSKNVQRLLVISSGIRLGVSIVSFHWKKLFIARSALNL